MKGQFGFGVSNCRPAVEVVRAVQEAEALGAGIAFIAEDINCRDAFELAALSVMGTDRIRLATGVVNPFTRNPTSLAMAVATLDEISQGRAVLGLGSSSPSLIEDQMGIPAAGTVGVMRESVEIIRALLGGEDVTYRGRHFTYTEASLSVRPVQERVPVYFAAMGPRMLRLAGQIADGVLLNVGASTEYVRWAVDEVRKGSREAGRHREDVTIAAWITAYVSVDREASLRRAREWLAMMLSIPRQGELLLEHSGMQVDASVLSGIRAHFGAYPHRGDRAAAAAYIPEELPERLAIIGDVDQARVRLDEYRAAGVDVPVLSLSALKALQLQQI